MISKFYSPYIWCYLSTPIYFKGVLLIDASSSSKGFWRWLGTILKQHKKQSSSFASVIQYSLSCSLLRDRQIYPGFSLGFGKHSTQLPHNSGEFRTLLKIQKSHGNMDLQKHLFNHLYFNVSFRIIACLNRLMLSELIFLWILAFPLNISVSLVELSPP